MKRLTALLLAACALPAAESQLFPGDLIKIEVFDNPELAVTTRVPGGGTVNFPLIGELPALAGTTAEALSREITRRLEDGYLRHAQVTVAVLEYGQRQAYVMGSVNRPGTVRIAPGQPLSALQAISDCGGFSDDAVRSATRLLREDPRDGTRTAIALEFSGDERDAAHDVPLRPGDVVVVRRADRVYVLGRVAKPGALNLPGNETVTVSKAISLSGGFERFAKDSQVQLLREGGKTVVVDVEGLLAGKAGIEDPPLKPGDTVFIPESRF